MVQDNNQRWHEAGLSIYGFDLSGIVSRYAMANQEHLEILKQGVIKWHLWRNRNPQIKPDLSKADLHGLTLVKAYLSGVNLRGASLTGVNLCEAILTDVDFGWAKFHSVKLNQAKLQRADLYNADFTNTQLIGANLCGANIIGTNFSSASLKGANLSGVNIGWAIFGDTDLTGVRGFDAMRYRGPSTIGIDTIYRSSGKLPVDFLFGCGVPNNFISIVPSLAELAGPFQLEDDQ